MHAFYGKEPRGGRFFWHIWQELVTTLLFFKLKIDYLKFSERLCIANDTMGLTRVTFFCPKKIEQDLNKPHPKYSKLSPSCQLSSSGGWLLPGFSQTVKMLWRACNRPSNNQIVKKQVNVSNFFCFSNFTFHHQVFIQPLSHWQSQAMTGPESDKKDEKLTLYHLTL